MAGLGDGGWLAVQLAAGYVAVCGWLIMWLAIFDYMAIDIQLPSMPMWLPVWLAV